MTESTRKQLVGFIGWIDMIFENIYAPIMFIRNMVNHRGSKPGNVILGLFTVKAILWWPLMLAVPDNREEVIRALKADPEVYDKWIGSWVKLGERLGEKLV